MQEVLINMVVAGIALAGLILGILNSIYMVRKDRVRLKITPKSIIQSGMTPNGGTFRIFDKRVFVKEQSNNEYAISVINLSVFPIIITEIGFRARRNKIKSAIPLIFTENTESLPVKIDPRDGKTFICDLNKLLNSRDRKKFVKAYVVTKCGNTFYGKSNSLRLLAQS